MTGSQVEYIKRRTQELYDSLPQDEEERKKHTEVRDEVMQLNYNFFGYIASHTYINDPLVTYEDKLQSALMHFNECWWWYKYEAKYRTDLSFTVFFKPRIGEMIERELNIVKYSIRRSLCMEVAKQLGKHWGKVTYDDLALVKLPPDKMEALQCIFGAMYPSDNDEYEQYVPDKGTELHLEFEALYSDEYDTIEEMLMNDMVVNESKISDSRLREFSNMFDIPFNTLITARSVAEDMLYKQLHNMVDDP